MRSEKRNRFFAILMALLLLAAVPAVGMRVQLAGSRLNAADLKGLVDYNNAYLDCAGTVIADNNTPVPDVFGNLIGFENYISNTLSSAYEGLLGPASFNRFTGVRSLKNKVGCQMETTLLPLSSQLALAEGFRNEAGHAHNGAVFAYNYQTGEIYTALSLPSVGSFQEDLPEGALFNKVLNGTFIPGSTMKIVALLCALEQKGMDLEALTFDCDGVTEAPDGSQIVCVYPHGKNLTIQDAIGMSCNGFITEMAAKFDVEEACQSLLRLGFSTQLYEVGQQHIGAMKRTGSSTVFADPNGFSDRWAFAGQGKSQVSCVDMAMIAGAIANNGKVAEPYLVKQIVNMDTGKVTEKADTDLRQLVSEGVARQADAWWTEACETYYNLPREVITYAKTGTAQCGDGSVNRALVGVMKEYNTAFFIYVEDHSGGSNCCTKVAAILADALGKLTGK